MANHASALKRVKQNEKRRLRNRMAMGEMRTAIKKFRALVAEKKGEDARKALPQVYALIDRTRKKGVIHPNAAARYKSRLARALGILSQN
ncbi:MAG: 30S ribosomal protein S20 [Acidobacteriota bacterium]